MPNREHFANLDGLSVFAEKVQKVEGWYMASYAEIKALGFVVSACSLVPFSA